MVVLLTALVKVVAWDEDIVIMLVEMWVIDIFAGMVIGELNVVPTNVLAGAGMVGRGIVMLGSVELGVVAALSIVTTEFSLSVRCSINATSDTVVGVFTERFAAVMIGSSPVIGVDELNDANVNGFEAVINALEFIMPPPLCEYSC